VTELRKVGGPSSGFDRHAGRIGAVVVAAILIAIIKPWGTSVGPTAVAPPSPRPTASPTPRPSDGPLLYDFRTFGTNEPPPSWEIWPAGNLASFYFAMRIDLAARASDEPGATPAPTPAATPTQIALASPIAGPVGGSVPSSWPTIRIPAGTYLDLIGLNRPLGYSIGAITLTRVDDDGTKTPANAIVGKSPWPEHFEIVGFAAGDGTGAMQPWPAGHFRLEVVIEPGHVTRTVDIVIDAASPVPSGSATGTAPPVP